MGNLITRTVETDAEETLLPIDHTVEYHRLVVSLHESGMGSWSQAEYQGSLDFLEQRGEFVQKCF